MRKALQAEAGAIRPGLSAAPGVKMMLNKVPEVTLLFWLVKMMSTTVGETGADLLSTTLGWGMNLTTAFVSVLLVLALISQFRANSYRPVRYWTVVVLISIAGTLASDMLVDGLGVPLWATTAVFGTVLVGVFGWWWSQERTLSIHTINTRKREAFYWLAILVTFALGTSGGDFLSEALNLGYGLSALVFLSVVLLIGVAHFAPQWRRRGMPASAVRSHGRIPRKLNAVFAFWAAYVLTRPLGASLGDLLSQPVKNGGLGFGTIPVSILFAVCIVAAVAWFARSERRAGASPPVAAPLTPMVLPDATQ